MNNSNKILAIIPARKGSKRLPHKNSMFLSGKPLIAWTIEPAIQSTFIDTVIVSTNDELIVGIGQLIFTKKKILILIMFYFCSQLHL